MPHATLNDLIALCGERELIQLTDRSEPPADEIDEAVAAEALGWADDQIDSYVSVAYRLPLSETPRLLKDIATDLARFRLYKEGASEEVKQRHDSALRHLDRIAKGSAKIPGVQGADPRSRAGVSVAAEAPVFSTETLAGFR